jgi:GGDEF domain-containing protein
MNTAWFDSPPYLSERQRRYFLVVVWLFFLLSCLNLLRQPLVGNEVWRFGLQVVATLTATIIGIWRPGLAGLVFFSIAVIALGWRLLDATTATGLNANIATTTSMYFMLIVWTMAIQTGPVAAVVVTVLGLVFLVAAGWLTGDIASMQQYITFTLSGLGAGWYVYSIQSRLHTLKLEMEHLALRDSLTGLGNRLALQRDFTTKFDNQPGQWLLITWDVNDLKLVNDREGHKAGDAYLVRFAGALKTTLDASSRGYRVGGDEFVSLYQHTDNAEQRIAQVHAQFPQVAAGWSVVSGGLDVALHHADGQMYEHKRRMKQQAVGGLGVR